MSRLIGTAILATAFAAVAVHAQDTTVKTTTKTEGGGEKTITYTGCVQTAPETRSFTLDHIVPVSRTTVTEAPGANGAAETTTTTTRYVLVPGPTVQFQQFVGHFHRRTLGMQVPDVEIVRAEFAQAGLQLIYSFLPRLGPAAGCQSRGGRKG